jgi:hypothetical protein
MNLKHLLSIYFLYFAGTTHALATKVMNIDYKKNKEYLRHIPEFYKEILKTWMKMCGVKHKRHHILQRFVWYQIVHSSIDKSAYP